MTVEAAVRARLLSLSAVTALVSTRVYLSKLPQHPIFPAVRVTLVSEIRTSHLRGGNTIKDASVQVDAFAQESSGSDPYASASAIAAAIQGDEAGGGLSGFRGDVGSSPPFVIAAILAETRRQGYDPAVLNLVTISQDYAVTFTGDA